MTKKFIRNEEVGSSILPGSTTNRLKSSISSRAGAPETVGSHPAWRRRPQWADADPYVIFTLLAVICEAFTFVSVS
jgi:hypothetical protein